MSDTPVDEKPAESLEHAPTRPGPVAWLVILAGFAVMAWAIVGVFTEAERTAPGSWFTWVIGGAIVHDAIVLPLVLLAGAGLASLGRPGLRRALRWSVAVCAVLFLASIPVLGRFGARADNPSVLPLPVGRNLAVVCAILLAGAVVIGLASDRWSRRRASAVETESDSLVES